VRSLGWNLRRWQLFGEGDSYKKVKFMQNASQLGTQSRALWGSVSIAEGLFVYPEHKPLLWGENSFQGFESNLQNFKIWERILSFLYPYFLLRKRFNRSKHQYRDTKIQNHSGWLIIASLHFLLVIFCLLSAIKP